MKLKIKIFENTSRMKSEISNDLKEYIKKKNDKYEFVSLNDNPDFLFCHNFKIWSKYFPDIIKSNKNILSNIIVFDRFKLNDKTSLRRLYLGTLSMKNTINIPYIENRADKLVNEYNVEFSKSFIINKKGVIVLCPNRHLNGWYKFNKETLTSFDEIERNINIIKKYSKLDIEIRIHPRTNENSIKYLLDKYNIKLNKDDINTLCERAYCIIADRSSIATKMFLKGNIIFNFQNDYEHSIIGNVCLTEPELLDPNKLDIEIISKKINRYNYLQYIATLAYTDDEINNGYFFNTIYNLLLENKDKFTKL